MLKTHYLFFIRLAQQENQKEFYTLRGGYMVYASMTHQYVFNYKTKDIYWCTADIGWITGHSYIIYGPLANGATTIMFEGVPNIPLITLGGGKLLINIKLIFFILHQLLLEP